MRPGFKQETCKKTWVGKADNLGFREQGTKDARTRCWLGYLSSPFSLSFPFFGGGILFGAGGGCLSLIQVHLLVFLGPPFVFITRAFLNPIWTLVNAHKMDGSCSRSQIASLTLDASSGLTILFCQFWDESRTFARAVLYTRVKLDERKYRGWEVVAPIFTEAS